MRSAKRNDRTRLLETAKGVAALLRQLGRDTRIRVRKPGRSAVTNTDGWSATVGDLGRDKPKLQIWLDHFSGARRRKFCACLYSPSPRQITQLTNRLERRLLPVRTITMVDTVRGKHLTLIKKIRSFNQPILEKYPGGETYFGIYDKSESTARLVDRLFCHHAVNFFHDVATSLVPEKEETLATITYAACENRKLVKAHLARERSRYLAELCKQRDQYRCVVCDMTFTHAYGKSLGFAFAEAHHRAALSLKPDRVKTRLEDLVTVCANCHRMLHRMDGDAGDVEKLRLIVRKHRRK